MTTLRAATPGSKVARRLATVAVLALGLAHCASDLSDLAGGDQAAADNPLDETPAWSRPYPNSPGASGGAGQSPNEQSYPGGDCATRQGTFCADFDAAEPFAAFNDLQGSPLPFGDTDVKLSGSRSMLVSAEATVREGTFFSKSTRHFATRATSFALDFQLSPEQVSESRAVVAAVDFLGNPAELYSLQLVYARGELGLEESYPESTKPNARLASLRLPSGAEHWSHLRLEGSFGAEPAATLRLIDDQKGTASVVGRESLELSPPSGMARAPSLALGIVEGDQPHEGWRLRYDNVVFDVR